jgi:hypothetical protein
MLFQRMLFALAHRILECRTPTILLLFALMAVFLFINLRERERELSNFTVTVQGWPWIHAVEHTRQVDWQKEGITPEISQVALEQSYARQVYGLEPSTSWRGRSRSRAGLHIMGNGLVAFIVIGACCVLMERCILKPRSGDM